VREVLSVSAYRGLEIPERIARSSYLYGNLRLIVALKIEMGDRFLGLPLVLCSRILEAVVGKSQTGHRLSYSFRTIVMSMLLRGSVSGEYPL
jgi:hypothetical protein